MSNYQNDNLVLIAGESATGKSASLIGLKNPEGVMYLNTESNKKLPFPAKFKQYSITDPLQVFEAFEHAETKAEIHTIVVDSLTFLMDMFESVYVLTASNTMKAWGDYNQYFKSLMQNYVAKSTKNVFFIAHTQSVLDEATMSYKTSVPIKGSLKGNGIESYFSTVLSTKRMLVKDLEPYTNKLLNITEEEKLLGFKYCFQTKLTQKTANERIRAPMGMWDTSETFIDNNVEHLITRLHEYYK